MQLFSVSLHSDRLGETHAGRFSVSRDDAVRMWDSYLCCSPELLQHRLGTLQASAQLLDPQVLNVVIREVQGLECARADNGGQDVATFMGQVAAPQAGHTQKTSKFATNNGMWKGDFCG